MEKQRLRVPLVLRGGGVKGIAFASALQELEAYFEFTQFIGTSAGAIVAVLLAAGYSPKELDVILRSTDFSKFLDAGPIGAGWNLLIRGGMYRCDFLRTWMDELLEKKLDRNTVRLRDLPGHVVIFASTRGKGTVRFDSTDENRDIDASAAVRCSMSIPFLFEPQHLVQRRIYDGGLLNNFPIDHLTDATNSDFVALYLGTGREPRTETSVALEVLSIWLGRDEIALLNKHRSKIVMIDPAPVRTTDFRLSEEEKEFLVDQGRAAALRFLKKREFPVNDEAATAAEQKASDQRARAIDVRKARRSWWRVAAIEFPALLVALFVLGITKDIPLLTTTNTTGVIPTVTGGNTTETTATATIGSIGTSATETTATTGTTATETTATIATETTATVITKTDTTDTVPRFAPPPPPPPPDVPATIAEYTELAGVKRGWEYADLVDHFPAATREGLGSGLQVTLPNGVIAFVPQTRRVDAVRVQLQKRSDIEAMRAIDPRRLWWLGRREKYIKEQIEKLGDQCKPWADGYECRADNVILQLRIYRDFDPICYLVEVIWLS